ncbi:hypothetical protein [Nocardia sp. NPDC051833]|uniref:hypothetical protein n=1 Tax=Nocardia sp. NPDC051833 TaxID=3155674 RepID=UPI00341F82C7
MSTLTAVASVVIAALVLWLNIGSRRDSQFRRVDELLTAFQSGSLSEARHLMGTFRHSEQFPEGWDLGPDGSADPAKPHTKALFDVLWFFKRVDATLESLPATGRLFGRHGPRRLLLRSLTADVGTWTEYLGVFEHKGVIADRDEITAAPNVFRSKQGLEAVDRERRKEFGAAVQSS